VKLVWADGSGRHCTGCSAPLSHDPTQVGNSLPGAGDHTAFWYGFQAQSAIVIPSGISNFWFEITENGEKRVEDQGGKGFALQTKVLVAASTCVNNDFHGMRVDIAVRFDLDRKD
jgi:hypothetical protein